MTIANSQLRLTAEDASKYQMWLLLIGFGIVFFMTAMRGELIITIIVMVGGVLGIFGMFVYFQNKYGQLTEQAEAKILGRQIQKEKDDFDEEQAVYWVSFEFVTAKGLITLSARVIHSVYEAVVPGVLIGVCYNKLNPRVALIEGEVGYGS